MAMQAAGRFRSSGEVAGRERVAWPSRIPANTVIGVYEGLVEAVVVAARLRHGNPEAHVWIVTGADGANQMRAARNGRSLLESLAGALGDEDRLLDSLIEAAPEGRTLLAASGSPGIARFANASAVMHVGRWTFGRIR